MLVAVLFLFSNICVFPSQALAHPAQSSTIQGGGSPAVLSSQPLTEGSWLPPELGSIDEVYRAQRATHNASQKNANDSSLVSCDRMVVFIQDAHDSLEAQENIAKIIGRLTANYGVKTVFEEGYEGPVPTDDYFGSIKDAELKRKVAYFFLDHLRIGGAEYAHINRAAAPLSRETVNGKRSTIRSAFPVSHSPKSDWQLIGADSLKLHKENVDQYRFSAERKDAIQRDLKALEKEVRSLSDARFPKEFKAWLRVKEQFDAKNLDLFTYLGRTMPLIGTRDTAHAPRQNSTWSANDHAWPVARGSWPLMEFILEAVRTNDPAVIEKAKHIDAREVFGELVKLEQSIADIWLRDATDRELYAHYRILALLSRLNEIQITQEEYESIKDALKAFDTQALGNFIHRNSKKPLVLSKQWERNIQEAVKFYEIAHERDASLSTALDSYFLKGRNAQRTTYNAETDRSNVERCALSAKLPGSETAILVYGGFHKENIKRILEAKGISYVVVSPKITKSSARHEGFYKQLMTHGAFPFEKAITPVLARASRTLPIFTIPNGRAEVRVVYDALRSNKKLDLGTLDKELELLVAQIDARSSDPEIPVNDHVGAASVVAQAVASMPPQKVRFDLSEIVKMLASGRRNWFVDIETIPAGKLKTTLDFLNKKKIDDVVLQGGVLRDTLLGLEPQDVNFTVRVSRQIDQWKIFFRVCRKLRLSPWRLFSPFQFNKVKLLGQTVNYVFSSSVAGDYLNDWNSDHSFTINKIGIDRFGKIYEPQNGEGFRDLSAGVIRLNPIVPRGSRLYDAMRAIRYQYQYQFNIEEQTRQVIDEYLKRDPEPYRKVSKVEILRMVRRDLKKIKQSWERKTWEDFLIKIHWDLGLLLSVRDKTQERVKRNLLKNLQAIPYPQELVRIYEEKGVLKHVRNIIGEKETEKILRVVDATKSRTEMRGSNAEEDKATVLFNQGRVLLRQLREVKLRNEVVPLFNSMRVVLAGLLGLGAWTSAKVLRNVWNKRSRAKGTGDLRFPDIKAPLGVDPSLRSEMRTSNESVVTEPAKNISMQEGPSFAAQKIGIHSPSVASTTSRVSHEARAEMPARFTITEDTGLQDIVTYVHEVVTSAAAGAGAEMAIRILRDDLLPKLELIRDGRAMGHPVCLGCANGGICPMVAALLRGKKGKEDKNCATAKRPRISEQELRQALHTVDDSLKTLLATSASAVSNQDVQPVVPLLARPEARTGSVLSRVLSSRSFWIVAGVLGLAALLGLNHVIERQILANSHQIFVGVDLESDMAAARTVVSQHAHLFQDKAIIGLAPQMPKLSFPYTVFHYASVLGRLFSYGFASFGGIYLCRSGYKSHPWVVNAGLYAGTAGVLLNFTDVLKFGGVFDYLWYFFSPGDWVAVMGAGLLFAASLGGDRRASQSENNEAPTRSEMRADVVSERLVRMVREGEDTDVADLLSGLDDKSAYQEILGKFLKEIEMERDGLKRTQGFLIASYISGALMGDRRRAAEYSQKAFALLCETVKQHLQPVLEKPQSRKIVVSEGVAVTAPVRLEFISQCGSDLFPITLAKGGRVMNASLRINGVDPVRVTMKPIKESKLVIRSIDHDSHVEITDSKDLGYENSTDPSRLVKAALVEMGVVEDHETRPLGEIVAQLGGGLEIVTDVHLPYAGTGLGVSSILGTAVVEGIMTLTGQPLSEKQVIAHVLNIEQRLGVGGGWQDGVGAFSGTVKKITAMPGQILPQREEAMLDPQTLAELRQRMVLFSLGEGHHSGDLLKKHIVDFMLRTKASMGAREKLRIIFNEMEAALKAGDLDRFGALLSQCARERVNVVGPMMTTPFIDEILSQTTDVASGGRVSGSGGGGFMYLIAKRGMESALRDRLKKIYKKHRKEFVEANYSFTGDGLSISRLDSTEIDPAVRERLETIVSESGDALGTERGLLAEPSMWERVRDILRDVMIGTDSGVNLAEIEIHPDGTCNLNCRHCRRMFMDHGHPTRITQETLFEFIDTIVEHNKTHPGKKIQLIKFSGFMGEPLVNKKAVIPAMQHVLDAGIKVALFTNGILMDDDVRQVAVHASDIRISVDAGSETSYLPIKGRDGYERILSNLRELARLKTEQKSKVVITMGYILHPENIPEIYEAVRQFKEAGAGAVRFNIDIYREGRPPLKESEVVAAYDAMQRAKADFEDSSFSVNVVHEKEEAIALKPLEAQTHDFRTCYYAHLVSALGDDNQVTACYHAMHLLASDPRLYGSVASGAARFFEAYRKGLKKWEGIAPEAHCDLCPARGYRVNTFMEFLRKAEEAKSGTLDRIELEFVTRAKEHLAKRLMEKGDIESARALCDEIVTIYRRQGLDSLAAQALLNKNALAYRSEFREPFQLAQLKSVGEGRSEARGGTFSVILDEKFTESIEQLKVLAADAAKPEIPGSPKPEVPQVVLKTMKGWDEAGKDKTAPAFEIEWPKSKDPTVLDILNFLMEHGLPRGGFQILVNGLLERRLEEKGLQSYAQQRLKPNTRITIQPYSSDPLPIPKNVNPKDVAKGDEDDGVDEDEEVEPSKPAEAVANSMSLRGAPQGDVAIPLSEQMASSPLLPSQENAGARSDVETPVLGDIPETVSPAPASGDEMIRALQSISEESESGATTAVLPGEKTHRALVEGLRLGGLEAGDHLILKDYPETRIAFQGRYLNPEQGRYFRQKLRLIYKGKAAPGSDYLFIMEHEPGIGLVLNIYPLSLKDSPLRFLDSPTYLPVGNGRPPQLVNPGAERAFRALEAKAGDPGLPPSDRVVRVMITRKQVFLKYHGKQATYQISTNKLREYQRKYKDRWGDQGILGQPVVIRVENEPGRGQVTNLYLETEYLDFFEGRSKTLYPLTSYVGDQRADLAEMDIRDYMEGKKIQPRASRLGQAIPATVKLHPRFKYNKDVVPAEGASSSAALLRHQYRIDGNDIFMGTLAEVQPFLAKLGAGARVEIALFVHPGVGLYTQAYDPVTGQVLATYYGDPAKDKKPRPIRFGLHALIDHAYGGDIPLENYRHNFSVKKGRPVVLVEAGRLINILLGSSDLAGKMPFFQPGPKVGQEQVVFLHDADAFEKDPSRVPDYILVRDLAKHTYVPIFRRSDFVDKNVKNGYSLEYFRKLVKASPERRDLLLAVLASWVDFMSDAKGRKDWDLTLLKELASSPPSGKEALIFAALSALRFRYYLGDSLDDEDTVVYDAAEIANARLVKDMRDAAEAIVRAAGETPWASEIKRQNGWRERFVELLRTRVFLPSVSYSEVDKELKLPKGSYRKTLASITLLPEEVRLFAESLKREQRKYAASGFGMSEAGYDASDMFFHYITLDPAVFAKEYPVEAYRMLLFLPNALYHRTKKSISDTAKETDPLLNALTPEILFGGEAPVLKDIENILLRHQVTMPGEELGGPDLRIRAKCILDALMEKYPDAMRAYFDTPENIALLEQNELGRWLLMHLKLASKIEPVPVEEKDLGREPENLNEVPPALGDEPRVRSEMRTKDEALQGKLRDEVGKAGTDLLGWLVPAGRLEAFGQSVEQFSEFARQQTWLRSYFQLVRKEIFSDKAEATFLTSVVVFFTVLAILCIGVASQAPTGWFKWSGFLIGGVFSIFPALFLMGIGFVIAGLKRADYSKSAAWHDMEKHEIDFFRKIRWERNPVFSIFTAYHEDIYLLGGYHPGGKALIDQHGLLADAVACFSGFSSNSRWLVQTFPAFRTGYDEARELAGKHGLQSSEGWREWAKQFDVRFGPGDKENYELSQKLGGFAYFLQRAGGADYDKPGRGKEFLSLIADNIDASKALEIIQTGELWRTAAIPEPLQTIVDAKPEEAIKEQDTAGLLLDASFVTPVWLEKNLKAINRLMSNIARLKWPLGSLAVASWILFYPLRDLFLLKVWYAHMPEITFRQVVEKFEKQDGTITPYDSPLLFYAFLLDIAKVHGPEEWIRREQKAVGRKLEAPLARSWAEALRRQGLDTAVNSVQVNFVINLKGKGLYLVEVSRLSSEQWRENSEFFKFDPRTETWFWEKAAKVLRTRYGDLQYDPLLDSSFHYGTQHWTLHFRAKGKSYRAEADESFGIIKTESAAELPPSLRSRSEIRKNVVSEITGGSHLSVVSESRPLKPNGNTARPSSRRVVDNEGKTVWGKNVTEETLRQWVEDGLFTKKRIAEGAETLRGLFRDTIVGEFLDLNEPTWKIIQAQINWLYLMKGDAFLARKINGPKEHNALKGFVIDQSNQGFAEIEKVDLKALGKLSATGWNILTILARAVIAKYGKASAEAEIIRRGAFSMSDLAGHISHRAYFLSKKGDLATANLREQLDALFAEGKESMENFYALIGRRSESRSLANRTESGAATVRAEMRELTAEEERKLEPEFSTAKDFFAQRKSWQSSHPDHKIIAFVRHGRSASNAFGYCQAYAMFSPLTILGWLEVLAVTLFFKAYGMVFGRYLTSDSERAFRTVEPLARAAGKKPEIYKELREIPTETFGGYKKSLAQHLRDKLFNLFMNDPDQYEIGDFSGKELHQYQKHLFHEEIVNVPEQSFLIGSHGITILLAIMNILKIPAEKFRAVYDKLGISGNVALTVFSYAPKTQEWKLLVRADNSFLPPLLQNASQRWAVRSLEKIFFWVQVAWRSLARVFGSRKGADLSDYQPQSRIWRSPSASELAEKTAEVDALVKAYGERSAPEVAIRHSGLRTLGIDEEAARRGNILVKYEYPFPLQAAVIGDETYQPKTDFHVTIVGSKGLLLNGTRQRVDQLLQEHGVANPEEKAVEISRAAAQGVGFEVRLLPEIRFASKQFKDEVVPRHSVLQSVQLIGLEQYLTNLKAELARLGLGDVTVASGPTHLTLLTAGNPRGIGIYSQEDLEKLTHPARSADELAVAKSILSQQTISGVADFSNVERSYILKGAEISQGFYEKHVVKGDKILPVLKVRLNGESYRVGGGYYLAIKLANGKMVYWAGQHNLSYSLFFEHYGPKAQGLIRDEKISWLHIDTESHWDGLAEVAYLKDHFVPSASIEWQAERDFALSLSGAEYLGYLVSRGIVRWPKHVSSLEQLKELAAAGTLFTVADIDIDFMERLSILGTARAAGPADRLAAAKPLLMAIAERSDVVFLINSSELNDAGSPYYIAPDLALSYNGALIEGLAEQALSRGRSEMREGKSAGELLGDIRQEVARKIESASRRLEMEKAVAAGELKKTPKTPFEGKILAGSVAREIVRLSADFELFTKVNGFYLDAVREMFGAETNVFALEMGDLESFEDAEKYLTALRHFLSKIDETLGELPALHPKARNLTRPLQSGEVVRAEARGSLLSIFHPRHMLFTAVLAVAGMLLDQGVLGLRDWTALTGNRDFYFSALGWIPDFLLPFYTLNTLVLVRALLLRSWKLSPDEWGRLRNGGFFPLTLVFLAGEFLGPLFCSRTDLGGTFSWSDVLAVLAAGGAAFFLHQIPKTSVAVSTENFVGSGTDKNSGTGRAEMRGQTSREPKAMGHEVNSFTQSSVPNAQASGIRAEMRTLTAGEEQQLEPEFPTAKAFFDQWKLWRQSHPGHKIVTIVRHGRSASNEFEYGQSYSLFSPLTLFGRLQAWALAQFFKVRDIVFDRYLASDLERAFRTVEPSARAAGQKPQIYKRLREIKTDKFGGYMKLLVQGLRDRMFDVFKDDPENFELPGFSGKKLIKYLTLLFHQDIVNAPEQTFLIGSHGLTILLAIMNILKIPASKYRAVYDKLGAPGNVALTVFSYDPATQEWQLLVRADNAYLPASLQWSSKHWAVRSLERLFYWGQIAWRLFLSVFGFRNGDILSDYQPQPRIWQRPAPADLAAKAAEVDAFVKAHPETGSLGGAEARAEMRFPAAKAGHVNNSMQTAKKMFNVFGVPIIFTAAILIFREEYLALLKGPEAVAMLAKGALGAVTGFIGIYVPQSHKGTRDWKEIGAWVAVRVFLTGVVTFGFFYPFLQSVTDKVWVRLLIDLGPYTAFFTYVIIHIGVLIEQYITREKTNGLDFKERVEYAAFFYPIHLSYWVVVLGLAWPHGTEVTTICSAITSGYSAIAQIGMLKWWMGLDDSKRDRYLGWYVRPAEKAMRATWTWITGRSDRAESRSLANRTKSGDEVSTVRAEMSSSRVAPRISQDSREARSEMRVGQAAMLEKQVAALIAGVNPQHIPKKLAELYARKPGTFGAFSEVEGEPLDETVKQLLSQQGELSAPTAYLGDILEIASLGNSNPEQNAAGRYKKYFEGKETVSLNEVFEFLLYYTDSLWDAQGRPYLTEDQKNLLREQLYPVILFAFAGVSRKYTEISYVFHLLGVSIIGMQNLMETGLVKTQESRGGFPYQSQWVMDMLVAGLYHDLIEDTAITLMEFRRLQPMLAKRKARDRMRDLTKLDFSPDDPTADMEGLSDEYREVIQRKLKVSADQKTMEHTGEGLRSGPKSLALKYGDIIFNLSDAFLTARKSGNAKAAEFFQKTIKKVTGKGNYLDQLVYHPDLPVKEGWFITLANNLIRRVNAVTEQNIELLPPATESKPSEARKNRTDVRSEMRTQVRKIEVGENIFSPVIDLGSSAVLRMGLVPCAAMILYDPKRSQAGAMMTYHATDFSRASVRIALEGFRAKGFDVKRSKLLIVGDSPMTEKEFQSLLPREDYQAYLERNLLERELTIQYLHDIAGVEQRNLETWLTPIRQEPGAVIHTDHEVVVDGRTGKALIERTENKGRIPEGRPEEVIHDKTVTGRRIDLVTLKKEAVKTGEFFDNRFLAKDAPRLKEASVFVIEQARIAEMKAPEQVRMLNWLLGFAAVNKGMLRIVIPDMAKNPEPVWVSDLKQVTQVLGNIPGNTKNVTPVFYFSDAEHEATRDFLSRLGRNFKAENATLVDIDDGRGFVLAALLGKKVEELPVVAGFFHRDVAGLYRSEIRLAVQALYDDYVVIASAA